MATTTTNLGLRKPENPDQVNVTTDIANNMQVIDDAFTPAAATNQLFGDTAVAGTALQAARADHKHGWPNFGTPTSLGLAISAGVASTPARSDHVHTLGTAVLGTPVAVGDALADGVSTQVARADHVHALGDEAVTTAKIAPLAVTTAKIALLAVTDAQVAAANKDGLAATPSLRTLGAGAQQAAAGNHAHASTNGVVLLGQSELGSDAAAFDFTSLPTSGYCALELIGVGRATFAAPELSMRVRFNGDTGNNYNSSVGYKWNTNSWNTEQGTGSIFPSYVTGASATADRFVAIRILIPDFLGALHKTLECTAMISTADTSAAQGTLQGGGVWKNAAAITRVEIIPGSGNWLAGSKMYLFGRTKA